MIISTNVREVINDCYLYCLNGDKITEYKGTVLVYKSSPEKGFIVEDGGKDGGRFFEISPMNGAVHFRRIWANARKSHDVVEKRFREYFEDRNRTYEKQIENNNKILKGGFKWQKDL